jgi:hypothetical protein
MRYLGARTLSVACLLLVSACEDEKPKAAPPAAPSAAPVAAPTPAPPPPAPTPTIAKRPKVDLELTDARRAAIESKYPEAKGFLVGKQLEEKLKANKAIKAKEGAVTAFDRAAKGKWVLFSGLMVNLTDKGFDLAIVYTPQLPNDVMGMSRQFFEVTLSEVEGYEQSQFKSGDPVVVLAKYLGGGKAAPAHELVATEVWK